MLILNGSRHQKFVIFSVTGNIDTVWNSSHLFMERSSIASFSSFCMLDSFGEDHADCLLLMLTKQLLSVYVFSICHQCSCSCTLHEKTVQWTAYMSNDLCSYSNCTISACIVKIWGNDKGSITSVKLKEECPEVRVYAAALFLMAA